MSDALARLTATFEYPFGRHGDIVEESRPVVVTSWPTVPVEIIRAAGCRAVVMRGHSRRTPLANVVLEPRIFPNRLHQLIQAALAGELADAMCLVLPRTSDPDYKAFLYLRELARRHLVSLRAPVLLFDLLQSHDPDVAAYNTARTRELFETLAALAGRRASPDDVRRSIEQTDMARQALARLMALRRGSPRVSGREVLPLIGAFWQLPPDRYATLANQAADVLERRAPLDGPRIALMGAPVDGPALHAAIESHGGVVVAEPGPWGSEAAGSDVTASEDPFATIAERYRHGAIGARTPRAALWRRLTALGGEVDGVVVSLPPDDAVFGWEYPQLRAWMEEHRLPHVCVSGDLSEPLAARDADALPALVATACQRAGMPHV
jgi:benzoyl-CoA reductase/2-hydroxyglutaryl-CoA dehydratase subunit BcrC/BadD/HgdB